MSDEEIVRAVAEKVMRWELRNDRLTGLQWVQGDPPRRARAEGEGMWNPLTSDADACAVLDKMAADGWQYQIRYDRYGERQYYHYAQFDKTPTSMHFSGMHRGRRRAICIAALKAVGAWEETSSHE